MPAANRLIASSSSLVGVLGAGTDDATAVVPLFQHAALPIFSTTGEASFDHSAFSYFWRILSPDAAQGSAMAAAAKKLGFSKVATVFGNDAAAQGSAPSAIAGVQRLHLNLTASQTLAVGQPSYRSEAEQLGSRQAAGDHHRGRSADERDLLRRAGAARSDPGADHRPGVAGATWRTAVGGAIGKGLLAKQDYAVVAYSPPTTPGYRAYTAALDASAKQVPQPSSGMPTCTRSRTTTRS